MISYNEFRLVLNNNLTSILSLLSKEFTSQQFIDAIRALLPNEYARILNGNSYRSVNVWISRWYLLDLSKKGVIVKRDHQRSIQTNNGNKSINQVRKKI